MTIEQTFIELGAWLNDANGRIHAAIRNLREVQPGYPTSTPGNGSPGSGRGGGATIDVSEEWEIAADYVPTTSVERGILQGHSIDDDDAAHDLGRLRTLENELTSRIREYRDIAVRWGYRTAGEYDAGHTRTQRPRDTETETNRLKWCTSHARLHGHGDEPAVKAGLCRFCYDYKAAERELPSLRILDLRSTGVRITEAVVRKERERRQLEQARLDGQEKPKRRRGKPATSTPAGQP